MTPQRVNNCIKGVTCSPIRALILKGQLTLGRKWAQLHGSRRPNSYHDDDALHFWPVKPFDLSSSKRRRVSGTKRSRGDHTFRTEPRVRHDILLHSYRLYAPSCWCTTIATIKLYSFRSRSVCRSRDDRSRTHARRWFPDDSRTDLTERTEQNHDIYCDWGERERRDPRQRTSAISCRAMHLHSDDEMSRAREWRGPGTATAPWLLWSFICLLMIGNKRTRKFIHF